MVADRITKHDRPNQCLPVPPGKEMPTLGILDKGPWTGISVLAVFHSVRFISHRGPRSASFPIGTWHSEHSHRLSSRRH